MDLTEHNTAAADVISPVPADRPAYAMARAPAREKYCTRSIKRGSLRSGSIGT